VARTHKNNIVINKVFIINVRYANLEEKIATVNILIAIMLVYSAIKIIAKGPALYSMLNPDTSSDSPSTRS
jgi:hypothetical protein